MKVRIVNKSAYPTPAYATEKSAGMDLKADIQEPVVLNPLERALIPTGLYLSLPDGTEAQVRPRSGLAAKHGSGSISPSKKRSFMVVVFHEMVLPRFSSAGGRIQSFLP